MAYDCCQPKVGFPRGNPATTTGQANASISRFWGCEGGAGIDIVFVEFGAARRVESFHILNLNKGKGARVEGGVFLDLHFEGWE